MCFILHNQLVSVFVLNFGGHHLPRVSDSLELDENVLIVGFSSRDVQVVLVLLVAVGADDELVPSLRQIVRHKNSVGIGHSRSNGLQGIEAFHNHVGPRKVRAVAVVGVVRIVVGDIHHQRACGVGDGGNTVRDAHPLTTFAVNGEIARVTNESGGTVCGETDGDVGGVVHSQGGQRITPDHRHPRHVRQRDIDIARRTGAVVENLEIHHLALSTVHRSGD